LRQFFIKLGREDRLALLSEVLNTSWSDSLRGELFTFVSVQHIDDVGAIFKLLMQVKEAAPRDIITDALILLTEKKPEFFIPRLQSSSTFEALAAIRALGRIGGPMLMDHVAGAYTRSEPAVRVQVLETLRDDRSPRVSSLMQDALDDPSSGVRLEALRYLASNRVTSALPILAEALRRRDFHGRTFEERRGWYIALGRLAGRDALQAFTQQAEEGKESRSEATIEKVHLALLGVRATRSKEGQAYLERFAEGARGELRAIVRRLISPPAPPPADRARRPGAEQ
jgi:HEAT repeat protein